VQLRLQLVGHRLEGIHRVDVILPGSKPPEKSLLLRWNTLPLDWSLPRIELRYGLRVRGFILVLWFALYAGACDFPYPPCATNPALCSANDGAVPDDSPPEPDASPATAVLGTWRISTNFPCAGYVDITLDRMAESAVYVFGFTTYPPEGPGHTRVLQQQHVSFDSLSRAVIDLSYQDTSVQALWNITLTPDGDHGTADVHASAYNCDGTRLSVPANRQVAQ
jgi:hypothetical protein